MNTIEKFLENKNYQVELEFNNENKETFFIYRIKNSNITNGSVKGITGDEFDWDEGWLIDLQTLEVYKQFILNEEEKEEIKKFYYSKLW